VISQFAFVNFADAERIFGVAGIVNYAMLIVDDAVPLDQVKQSVVAHDAKLQVYTASGFAEAVRKEVNESFIPIIAILVAIGFIVGSAVVGLTIYTATIERTREFGVMKAVGASPGFLYRIVLSQSLILTAGGFVVGLLAAMGTADLAARAVPEFATEFRASDMAVVLGAAALMALVASFVPVRRIVSIDPAMVFRA
jgi:putative ABC transport system permease protein